MRRTGWVIIALVLGSAQPCIAKVPKWQAEIKSLETRMMILTDHFDPDTSTLSDIGAALGVKFDYWHTEKCYPGTCFVIHDAFDRFDWKDHPYNIDVVQLSKDFISFDQSWTEKEPNVEVVLRQEDRELCFSVSDWNSYLVSKGWPPLKPYQDTEDTMISRGDFSRDQPVIFHLQGYMTQRNGIYLILNGPGRWRVFSSARELKSVESLQDCMKEFLLRKSAPYINGQDSQ